MLKRCNIKKSIIVYFILTIFSACSMTSGTQDGSAGVMNAYRQITDRNPILTHTFGADPTVLVYNGRVYIYMTADTPVYEQDGSVRTNDYANINTLRVVSSGDLANWIYHEPIRVAGHGGLARWAGNSWAPAVTTRQINGEDKFFLYFSNSANGVGVLTADSPLGPWSDPLGRALVSRQTPNCSDVPWVFDPAVFIDNDGRAYLYFGGGVPQGREADPGSARVVMLNDDMISLAGDPVRIDVPYFFEALGMNKIEGRYILSYCTNWNVTDSARTRLGIDRAVIAVMSANNPMGPFTLEGTIFRNPGTFFGFWGNNHHDLFEFGGRWYIAYHSQILEEAMGIRGKGYRATHINAVTVSGGRIQSITGTRSGVEQTQHLNPYNRHTGALSGISAGLTFESMRFLDTQEVLEYADITQDGSWLGIYGADFGVNGAFNIEINLRSGQANAAHRVEIRLGSPTGELIASFEDSFSPIFENYSAALTRTISGVHDIFFIFYGGRLNFGWWQFSG
jgi:arabinoxylan arabinofuranohydrolase